MRRGREGAGGVAGCEVGGAGLGEVKRGGRGRAGGREVGGGESKAQEHRRRAWPPESPLKMHMEAVASTASEYKHQLHAALARHRPQSSVRSWLWQPTSVEAHELHASGHQEVIPLLRSISSMCESASSSPPHAPSPSQKHCRLTEHQSMLQALHSSHVLLAPPSRAIHPADMYGGGDLGGGMAGGGGGLVVGSGGL